MKKIAFLFPGQGAQEVGMGRDLFGKGDSADALISAASSLVGEDLAKLCVRGPDRRLAETRYLQPSLTVVSLALLDLVVDAGIEPVMVAGHSVGELSACAASGAIDLLECVQLAVTRGDLMGNAAGSNPGGMIAVTGPPSEDIFDLIEHRQDKDPVTVATVNAASQVTISGTLDALDRVTERLKDLKDTKIVKLRVEGAWHSSHMESAVSPFAAVLERINIKEPFTPMVFNRDGLVHSAPNLIREKLAGQLTKPVRWDLVMKHLNESHITDYLEIGPGKVLRGLTRLNIPNPSIRVHNINNRRSLERTLKELV